MLTRISQQIAKLLLLDSVLIWAILRLALDGGTLAGKEFYKDITSVLISP